VPTERAYAFGNVLGVIQAAPVIFSVSYMEMERDHADPHNTWPHVYTLIPDRREHLLDAYQLWIRDETADDFLRDDKERTIFALQYAFSIIASMPETQEIRVTSSDHKDFRALPKLEGLELRNAILRFYFDWYWRDPRQLIGYPDLILSIPAKKENITRWIDPLLEGKFITGETLKAFEREMGFGFSTRAHRLNTEKVDEIERLGSHGGNAFRIFLSYSTGDKELAGRIAELLRTKYKAEVFLAHENLKVSQEWRGTILQELEKCHCLIALVTENFKPSDWTDQEVGNAIGRGKKVMSIFHQRKLHGFLEMYQGVALTDDLESLVARIGDDLGLAKR
jgi:hypothetical protein